ncbi:MAG TPA: DUF4238 domain-containing protein, partial [Spirochaetia bacterium]|nr:DUF4238 domain-containing protein [Spirochaetia bacterium]
SYLARFCAETADPQQEPYVWVFSREKGRVFRRSPKKTATRSYYYSFTSDEGQLDHEIEEHLGVVESKAASIIDRLVAGGSPEVLTPDDRANLSYFIAYMGHRVPSFRSHWEEQLGKIGEMMGKTAASNKDYFHRFITEHMEKGDIESDIDVEELREFVLSDKYELRGHPFQSLRLMVELTKTVAEIVFSFQWRLLRNATSFPLFTSDAPLSLVTTEKLLPPFNLGVGWRSPFMEALLPLSPTTALMISQHHPEGQESATPRQVLEANLRTQAYAQNEVYSSSPNIGAHLQLPRDWQWWVPLSSEVDPELED